MTLPALLGESDAWSVVSAIAGAVAAVAAAVAVRQTSHSRKQERRLRRTSRREDRARRMRARRQEYYAAYVQCPLCAALDSFAEHALRIAEQTRGEIQDYGPAERKQRVREGILLCKREWQTAWNVAYGGLESFGDESLRADIRKAMEDLEEAYSREFARLGEGGAANLRSAITRGAARVRAVIMAHDPGLQG